jgi:hypothetical protein
VNATPVSAPPTPTTTNGTPQHQQQDWQNRQEKSKLAHHFNTPGVNRELVIEGVRFTMKEDGSKLIRVTGEPWNAHGYDGSKGMLKSTEPSATSPRTPKKAVVAGVEFFRTKNGNLLRSATINVAAKYDGYDMEAVDNRWQHHRPTPKPAAQCEHFIKNGILSKFAPFNRCPMDWNMVICW